MQASTNAFDPMTPPSPPLVHNATDTRTATASKKTGLDRAIEEAQREVDSGKITKRQQAIPKLAFMKSLQRLNVKPSELMLSSYPVLPPAMRPVAVMGNTNTPLVADVNYLYREVMGAKENYEEMSKYTDDVSNERLAIYDTLKAVAGLSDPAHPELREKRVSGLLKHITGKGGPKTGVVQRKLLSTNVDLVGRGVIIPDTNLSMDEIGIPENQAWDMFHTFVARDLRSRGMPMTQVLKEIRDKTPQAKQALMRVTEERPAVYSRAPVLHKYGVLGGKVKLVEGAALRVSPNVYGGLGADNDGDQQIGKIILSIPDAELHKYYGCATAKTLASETGTATLEAPPTSNILKLIEVPMASLTKAGLPIRHNSAVFICDLEDFPHLEKIRSSDGAHGHIDWYAVPEGLQVMAIDPLTQEVEWATVTNWTKHHGCKVEIVTLRSGRQIFTDNDPRGLIAVFPMTGSLGTRSCYPSEAAEKGGLIPRAQRYGAHHHEPGMRQVQTLPEHRTNICGRAKFTLPEELPLDGLLGWYLGAVCGDGWSEHVKPTDKVADDGMIVTSKFVSRGICIANVDEGTKARFAKALNHLLVNQVDDSPVWVGRRDRKGDGTWDNGYGDSDAGVVQSAGLARFTRWLVGVKATGKHLPPFFLTAPTAFRSGLFAGLLDTDGTVHASTTKQTQQLMTGFASTSLRLCREISLLAWSLDIRNRVTKAKVTDAGNQSWYVNLNAADVQKWLRLRPSSLANKSKRSTILNTPVTDELTIAAAARHDLVPITPDLASVAASDIGMRKRAKGPIVSCYHALRKARQTGYVTRKTALDVRKFAKDRAKLERHPDWKMFWHWAQDHRVTWEPIEDFERTETVEVGYDISVPGYENWMNVDGVFCPNTMNFHVPVGQKAVQNVRNRLMPSTMLRSVDDFKSPMFKPSQDQVLGLYFASKPKKKASGRIRVFRSVKEMQHALEAGELDYDDRVKIASLK